jgi:hypothetical protein
MRAKGNLEVLSKQIDSSFKKDILNAYKQLDSLDYFINSKRDSILPELNKKGKLNVSDLIISYFRSSPNHTRPFYSFDRIIWNDSSGQQKVKGQLENTEPLFTNVSSRNYFQVFKNDKPYMLHGIAGSFFGFEPLNSWTDGEFRIVISKKSHLQNGFIVALATQMPSVIQTILPPGFGFCIIDDTGRVQLHSDMNRNLQENIIEKMSPSRPVKEAVTSRQSTYFNNLKFYGKTNAASITPISQIPFSIVTFYDKGYIVPITMRIFTFALLFCFFSFFICLLIWLVVFGKRYYANPMLYSPMVFLKWAIPKNDSYKFYLLAKRFLIGYALMLLLFMAFSNYFGISNYVVLVLVLMIPVNVIVSLFVISYSATKYSEDKKGEVEHRSKKAIRAIVFLLLSTPLVYFYSWYLKYQIDWPFLIFQGVFIVAMLLYYFSSRKFLLFLSRPWSSYLLRYSPLEKILIFSLTFKKFYPSRYAHLKKSLISLSKTRSYLAQYAGLAAAIIICLAVLPAGLYTWYAHNQEITQSVKKEQLYLAQSLEKRRPSVLTSAKKRDSLYIPANYYEKLQYQSGIYKIYRDSIIPVADLDSITIKRNKDSYEQFYFAIANDIGNNYYDPLLFPALKDRASDSAWYWSRHDTTLSFWYTFPDMSLRNAISEDSGKSLNIISYFPERYLFVGFSPRGLLLVIVVVFLIRGLYVLLRSLTERIFLKKFISVIESKNLPENRIEHLLPGFNKTTDSPYPGFDEDIKHLKKEYDYYIPVHSNKLVNEQEKEMFDSIKKYKSFYDFIWRNATEKEKYLLLDFAEDNLTNFKNIEEIYSLLEKGIFIIHGEEIKLFRASFRAYLITKKNTTEVYLLRKKFQQNSTWQSFRVPLLIILLGIALFIFFTQQEISQKLTAMIAGISGLLSLLLKFFSDASSTAPAKK